VLNEGLRAERFIAGSGVKAQERTSEQLKYILNTASSLVSNIN